MIVHPNYAGSDLSNDIAIIKLPRDATLNSYVQPICLSDSGEISDVVDQFGTVVGWGQTEKSKLANVLRQAAIPVVSSSTCIGLSPTFSQYLTETTFCGGYLNGTL